jgi:hypothetical protein
LVKIKDEKTRNNPTVFLRYIKIEIFAGHEVPWNQRKKFVGFRNSSYSTHVSLVHLPKAFHLGVVDLYGDILSNRLFDIPPGAGIYNGHDLILMIALERNVRELANPVIGVIVFYV